MKILAIETSCDETALAVMDVTPGKPLPTMAILAHEVASQVEQHREFGGVVPNIARREHVRLLPPLTARVLGATERSGKLEANSSKLAALLERYPELTEHIQNDIVPLGKPAIDAIAVTNGPGLEPALWVGIQFAKALAVLWDVPLVGTDHMEGHIAANFIGNNSVAFPALALTVSGGHTQLIYMKEPLSYELLGETVDDAAGEAFDKVARMLNLPYPGGPEIARLAQKGDPAAFAFPRPMLDSGDYRFSFSGLKTSVLYTLKEMNKEEISERTDDIAASFQQAVVETLVTKTMCAAQEYNVRSVLLGGGVAANEELRRQLGEALAPYPAITLYIPPRELATDNAAMIGAAGAMHFLAGERSDIATLSADGNKQIGHA
ncbi:MAG: tRNA (adenosine(37)-N6)-threonylcarbamoyltransferase complex transferase subunit TsaD [Candidatus Spechtbacterales bacterium]